MRRDQVLARQDLGLFGEHAGCDLEQQRIVDEALILERRPQRAEPAALGDKERRVGVLWAWLVDLVEAPIEHRTARDDREHDEGQEAIEQDNRAAAALLAPFLLLPRQLSLPGASCAAICLKHAGKTRT